MTFSIGWLLFRDIDCIAEELQHEVDYLVPGVLKDIGINFSTSTMFLAAQHHLFTTLGWDGYVEKHSSTLKVAQYIMNEVDKIPVLKVIDRNIDIPVICFEKVLDTKWSSYDLEEFLEKETGWHIATYEMPSMDKVVHRIVVRSDLTLERAKEFLADLRYCIDSLQTRSHTPANALYVSMLLPPTIRDVRERQKTIQSRVIIDKPRCLETSKCNYVNRIIRRDPRYYYRFKNFSYKRNFIKRH